MELNGTGNFSEYALPGESEADTIQRLLTAARDKPLTFVPAPLERLPSAVLSDAEQAVMTATVEAWNAFLLLPQEHSDDQAEFRRLINALQSMILMRPTRRAMNFRPGE